MRTPQTEALWATGQKLLFETIRSQGGPSTVVTPSDEETSIACGAHIRADYRRLPRWTPRIDPQSEQAEVPQNGLLIATSTETEHSDRCVLAHALERAGLDGIAFHEDARQRDEDWYADLRRLTEFSITVRDGEVSARLEPGRERDEQAADRRAEHIDVRMIVTSPNGRREVIETKVDVAWQRTRGGCWPQSCGTIVSKASTATPDQIAEWTTIALYEPSRRNESSEAAEGREEFRAEAQRQAYCLLVSDEAGTREALRTAVRRHVLGKLPEEYTARITIDRDAKIEVTLQADNQAGTGNEPEA